jgi:8-oxo-dGTP pyrophosphatase MutT (NUDIX family)
MNLRELSTATDSCIDAAHNIFDALKAGRCPLSDLEKLVGNGLPDGLRDVGGMVTKIAIALPQESILVLQRANLPGVNAVFGRVPGFGSLVKNVTAGNYDLPGGMCDLADSCVVSGGSRELHEETGLIANAARIRAVGCYVDKGLAVVRVGLIGTSDDPSLAQTVSLSPEHVDAMAMHPGDSRFPQQWQPLADMAVAA